MIIALFKVGGFWIALLAGSSIVLSAAYTLRLVRKLVFGKPALPEPDAPRDLNIGEGFALLPLLVLLVVLGFLPGPVLSAARSDLLQRLPSPQTTLPEVANHAAGR
jgi:NADH-quinone oxidoreductase subunit M